MQSTSLSMRSTKPNMRRSMPSTREPTLRSSKPERRNVARAWTVPAMCRHRPCHLQGYPHNRMKEKQMIVIHWLGGQLVLLIGACYAVVLEQAIVALPHGALDAA